MNKERLGLYPRASTRGPHSHVVQTVTVSGDSFSVDIHGIKVAGTTELVTIEGPKMTIRLKAGASIITFDGLPLTLLVYKIHKHGITFIPDDTSKPFFWTWHEMLTGNSIINDCLRITGWMEVS